MTKERKEVKALWVNPETHTRVQEFMARYLLKEKQKVTVDDFINTLLHNYEKNK